MSVATLERTILRAHSTASDPRRAVAELHAGVTQPDTALVLFFCSSHYDLPALASELNRAFAGVPVVGCTTAGEFGPAGYRDHSLTGVSFPRGEFAFATGHLEGLQRFELGEGTRFTQALLQRLERAAPGATARDSFGMLMIDGLSMREEAVSRVVQHGLGGVAIFGGSAGDDLAFRATHVFSEGAFHNDSAVLVLGHTKLPFRVFKTQHFVATDKRIIVTAADPVRRIVHEIDGYPAAEAYARLIGVDPKDLDADRFAASPIVVLIDSTDYVRAIQRANPDGSLSFFCAIDEGVVLRVAHSVDLVGNLEEALAGIRAEIGPPQLVVGCDCILRNLEATQRGVKARIGDIFRRSNAVGFSTYGEQFRGVHINQTLTGIAFGARRDV